MKKILRYFPLNKILVYGNKISLLKVIGIYWGTAIGLSFVYTLTRWIPLIKNLTLRVSDFYTYYILAGCALAIAQFFMKPEQDEISYVTVEDVKKLWGIDKVKKGLLIAAAVLCILPTGSNKSYKPKVEETVVQTEEKNTEVVQAPEASIESKTEEAISKDTIEESTEEIVEEIAETEEVEYIPKEEKFVPGNYVGLTEYPGIEIEIYGNGAVVTEHKGLVSHIYIPSYVKYDNKEYPVKAIGDDVFSWDSNVYKIYVPDTVTTIGDRSIQGCKFLNTLHLSNNLTYIGEASIMSNDDMRELYVPSTVYEVGEYSLCDSGKVVSEQPKKYTMPEMTIKDQNIMQDFIMEMDGMNIHYQHNGFMDITKVQRESIYTMESYYAPDKWKYMNLVVREYGGTGAQIYFTTEEIYNEYVERASLVTDYGCLLSSFDSLSNVIMIPCDGFALIYDKYDYKPDLKKWQAEAEKEIYRIYEISKAFTLTDEVDSEKNILNMVCENYSIGKYKIKSKDDIYVIEARCGVEEQSYLVSQYYISKIHLEKRGTTTGYLVVNDDVFVEAETYGYGFLDGIEAFCGTFANDWYVVLVEEGQGPDLSKYPQNNRNLSSEEEAEIRPKDFFVKEYFTQYQTGGTAEDRMLKNTTIDAFKEYFEIKN